MSLNTNITLFEGRTVNTKASEQYVHVKFIYPDVNKELKTMRILPQCTMYLLQARMLS